MKTLFYHFFRNLVRCFSGRNIFWHLLAIVFTAIIVLTGFDWRWFMLTRNISWLIVLWPAVFLGGILPIFVPLVLLVTGKIINSLKIINFAWALGQAAILGLLISGFYKAFTGRIPPHGYFRSTLSISQPLIDTSHGFQFGILRGGVFWGWPSTHTTIAFAMALTLWRLFPENKIIKYTSILYAFYVGLGVSVSIHWFSEFAAGAILGSVIGIVVGKCFSGERKIAAN